MRNTPPKAERISQPAAPPRSPYKFLAAYEYGDRDLFVGREREIESLVTDVVSSRLVVLFARTGTGKTSLINAGVVPRLRQLDYETFYIRVERDPVRSVSRALRDRGFLRGRSAPRTLPNQLRAVSQQLKKPIVVFFDQFEEFFIHFGGAEHERTIARFVKNVADLYRDSDSGVHSVFSMREEYFVEMDVFRDELPAIFHNESSLRLRPFVPKQAIAVIREPAARVGIEVERALAERIVADLEERDGIEPARLQIVCDTLWRAGRGERMSRADYERLGGAERIVAHRLEEDILGFEDAHLRLFERLLPELRTEYGTKYLRGVDELRQRLETDPGLLEALLARLRNAHLLQESTIHRARYVEWTSDYLAERTEYLRTRTRVALHRRLLSSAVARARSNVPRSDDLVLARAGRLAGEDGPADSIAAEDFDSLSRDVSDVGELTREETAYAFGAALAHGAHGRLWFERADRRGVDVWAVLEDALRDAVSLRPAENAIRLLGQLGADGRAIDILEKTLEDATLGQSAFQALARIGTDRAVEALEGAAVGDEAKAGQAIDALRRTQTAGAVDALARAVRRGDRAGLRAGIALSTLAADPHAGPRADQARKVLDTEASALFIASLRHGLQTQFWFERARDHGVAAWEILRTSVVDPGVPVEQAEGALRLLRELPDAEANELVELAAHQRRLTEEAKTTREARDERKRFREETAEREALGPPAGGRGMSGHEWQQLLQRIAAGKCLPILGSGTAAGTLPLASEIARKWARSYDYPLDDSADLASVAQFVTVRYDAMFPREALAQELREAGTPDFSRPDDPYGTLARLPLPLYLTTSYDDFMLRALRAEGKDAHVDICRWNSHPDVQAVPTVLARDFRPTSASPVVFHLYGQLNVPESLVMTQDDYLDFIVAVSSNDRLLPHQIREALATSSLLFMGFVHAELEFNVLNRGLVMAGEASLRRMSVSVELEPPNASARDYLSRYFDMMNIGTYWGTSAEFVGELGERLNAFSHGVQD